jgi:hypothetical protein
MTALVLVTVCTTLSLVALVFLFVVMFNGLGNRVTTGRYREDLRYLDDRLHSLEKNLNERIDDSFRHASDGLDGIDLKRDQDYSNLKGEIKILRKTIDSRCDRLEHRFLKEAQNKTLV